MKPNKSYSCIYKHKHHVIEIKLWISNLISFLDIVTLLPQEGDAANHSCTYCNKCHLQQDFSMHQLSWDIENQSLVGNKEYLICMQELVIQDNDKTQFRGEKKSIQGNMKMSKDICNTYGSSSCTTLGPV